MFESGENRSASTPNLCPFRNFTMLYESALLVSEYLISQIAISGYLNADSPAAKYLPSSE